MQCLFTFVFNMTGSLNRCQYYYEKVVADKVSGQLCNCPDIRKLMVNKV